MSKKPIFFTLENVKLHEIVEVFNLAFNNYFVPVSLSLSQLKTKIRSEDLDLSLSAGAFIDGKLVGFILHGSRMVNGEKQIYNAGTGVVPEARGKGIAFLLYDFIMPLIHQKAIDRMRLEVIRENFAAISVYQKVGFKIKRELPCFKGQFAPKSFETDNTLKIEESKELDWQNLIGFWDWEPTWQYMNETILQSDGLKKLLVQRGGQVLAYAVYTKESGKIHQLAVKKSNRRKGLATAIMGYVANDCAKELVLINVDGKDAGMMSFLQKMGFERFLVQLEMEMELN